MYVTLHSSTCFEQHAAHHQEDQLYHNSLWYRHPLYAAVQYAGGERTAVRSPPAYCDTIGPPDDEQRAARNMLRSVM